MKSINENTVEAAALEYLRQLGYATAFGPDIAPEAPAAERSSYEQVYLFSRLRAAAIQINFGLNTAMVDEAIKRLGRAESQNPIAENLRVHKLLTEGVPVEHRDPDGAIRTTRVRLIDFEAPASNDWLAVNQFTITENGKNRRPDVVIFVNGIPLGLLELKNLADEHATLKGAWNQIQTYRHDIPSLFTPNVVTVVSDGISAAMSSFTAGFEHYAPWKTIDGREVVISLPAIEVLIKGVFDQMRFLDILQNFIVFSDEANGLVKRVTKYHQYWAVNAAVESTI
nr:type I restriction endonuclease [Arthrobacter sp. 131MFCol6.1]